MPATAPGPAAQVDFLGNIERLLAEGQFTATYKYALLIALADLAVERGSDDGGELELPVSAIGEKFIELYWRQAVPFAGMVADTEGGVLHQNTGRQAAMVSRLARMRRQQPTLLSARRSRAWSPAVREATQLVRTMPLWRLQVLGRERQEFLYRRGEKRGTIVLQPGIAAHLRRFHGLIVRLAQSEWIRFVQDLPANQWLLGPTSNLGEFLFGAERRNLTRLRDGLDDLQKGRCFYCGSRMSGPGEVDHFIPWSRYPRDLAHNFVLAHKTCNTAKRDLLAAEPHLERWVERSTTEAKPLAEIGSDAGFVADWTTSRRVAKWSYGHAEAVSARVWMRRGELRLLGVGWRALLD